MCQGHCHVGLQRAAAGLFSLMKELSCVVLLHQA